MKLIWKKEKRHKIGKNSIKESADTLPMGLCFSRLNGHPYLVNEKMNELSSKLYGKTLQNEEKFWKNLQNENFRKGIQKVSSKNIPAVILEDGTVWVFQREIILVEGKDIIQLTATNTTRLYKLSKELYYENKELQMMNQRLQKYQTNLTEFVAAQERLSMKMRIHDSIGQNLIATKYFLLQDKMESDLSEILGKWNQSIAMLKQEVYQEQDTNDAVKNLIHAAKSVGVQIIFEGEIPKSGKTLDILIAAGAEALTNLVRHTKEKILKIKNEKTPYTTKLIFSNDKNTVSYIKEGGGLSSLRAKVEQAGGTMKIITNHLFSIEIELPEVIGGNNYD